MNIDCIKVGELETNCYVLSKNNEVIIIDPGDEYDKIKKIIGNRKVIGVIVTHYHFDHIGALNYFDKRMIYDISNLKEGINSIGPFTFNVIYTPGHREDLITIYFKKEKIMFVGDFIFKGSIGRTDLETGNMIEMIHSIRKIKQYDDNIIIYPGHGSSTILGMEKKYNPYFK